jgi:serine protease Do
MRVMPLSDQDRKQLGLHDVEGVLVRQVSPGPAKNAGVRSGDVIVMLDGKRTPDMNSFKSQLDGLPAGKSVAVLIQRRDGPVFLALRVPEAE